MFNSPREQEQTAGEEGNILAAHKNISSHFVFPSSESVKKSERLPGLCSASRTCQSFVASADAQNRTVAFWNLLWLTSGSGPASSVLTLLSSVVKWVSAQMESDFPATSLLGTSHTQMGWNTNSSSPGMCAKNSVLGVWLIYKACFQCVCQGIKEKNTEARASKLFDSLQWGIL